MAETRTERTPAADPAFNPARPETRKTPIDNPADGKAIKATYRPLPGDPDETEVFGKKVTAGEAVEFDPKYAGKLRGNPAFEISGEETYGDDSRKEDEPEEQDEASFEDNVARERSDEYLNGRPQFTSGGPGEAERVARAQQAAAELNAAKDDADADKPRRGRPPKDR